MQKEALSIRRFSRWMRAVCSILLSRNRPAERAKALSYVQQAIEILKDPNDSAPDSEGVCSSLTLRNSNTKGCIAIMVVLSRGRTSVVVEHQLQHRCHLSVVSLIKFITSARKRLMTSLSKGRWTWTKQRAGSKVRPCSADSFPTARRRVKRLVVSAKLLLRTSWS